jgi:hypothetical protein
MYRRYPHRNAVLGRVSTQEEIDFLAASTAGWMKSGTTTATTTTATAEEKKH